MREQMRKDASRHRYRHEPPATPAGFWDLGFMDSLVSHASAPLFLWSIAARLGHLVSALRKDHDICL